MLKNSELSKLSSFKKTLSEWSLVCTFHCYPKIFQYEHKVAKIFWSVLFLVFSGFTAYLVVKGLQDYFEYEVVSKIRIVNEAALTFPTVTVCDSDPFTTKQAGAFLKDMWREIWDKDVDRLSESEFISNQLYLIGFAKMKAASALLNDTYKQSFGLNTRNNLESCVFNKQSCNLT